MLTLQAATFQKSIEVHSFKFLCRVADILSDYLAGLNEYEEMIAPPSIVGKMLSVVTGNSSNMSNTLPGATASCIPWRITDLTHASNEVYVDLVKEMDAIINRIA